ncbi:MAG TPA: tRNA (adenosine(37)-N6)-threonylcarbamoyltransferase complex dimerization subunit type 1 TsaB [Corynebacterium sp.]|nr:tRNA (adenosine(37)-N6)-threonylcarbamoyltransferase complex dimerization subunit type 1 TsaB [Corynebacterium sp.]
MLVLAIDTATSDLVAGLVDTATGRSRDLVTTTRNHNENLVPAIQRVLAEASVTFADLGAVVVGHGPGPFTGLRVGMSTAAAIAQARGIPVHGVGTHDAIARQLRGRALVATDARRREIYWATYDEGRRTAGPSVVRPAELVLPHPVDIVSIPEHLAEQIDVRATYVDLSPRAAGLVACADLGSEPAPLQPAYLRRPDAVPPKPVPRSPAIPEVEL